MTLYLLDCVIWCACYLRFLAVYCFRNAIYIAVALAFSDAESRQDP